MADKDEVIDNAINRLSQLVDGSNWPEYARDGDGYQAYTEISGQLHELLTDLQAVQTPMSQRPIPHPEVAAAPSAVGVIIKKGRLYYRGGWKGYTEQLREAGRYDREQAQQHKAQLPDGAIEILDVEYVVKQATPRVWRGMAIWHEQHAKAFPEGSEMQLSHLSSARELRARAEAKEEELARNL